MPSTGADGAAAVATRPTARQGVRRHCSGRRCRSHGLGWPGRSAGHLYGENVAFGAALRTGNLRRLALYEGWPCAGPRTPHHRPRLTADPRTVGPRKPGPMLEAFFRDVVHMSDDEIVTIMASAAWPARVAARPDRVPRDPGVLPAGIRPRRAAHGPSRSRCRRPRHTLADIKANPEVVEAADRRMRGLHRTSRADARRPSHRPRRFRRGPDSPSSKSPDYVTLPLRSMCAVARGPRPTGDSRGQPQAFALSNPARAERSTRPCLSSRTGLPAGLRNRRPEMRPSTLRHDRTSSMAANHFIQLPGFGDHLGASQRMQSEHLSKVLTGADDRADHGSSAQHGVEDLQVLSRPRARAEGHAHQPTTLPQRRHAARTTSV